MKDQNITSKKDALTWLREVFSGTVPHAHGGESNRYCMECAARAAGDEIQRLRAWRSYAIDRLALGPQTVAEIDSHAQMPPSETAGEQQVLRPVFHRQANEILYFHECPHFIGHTPDRNYRCPKCPPLETGEKHGQKG